MARIISSTVSVIFEILTPLSGSNSYSVTIGPGLIPRTTPYTPNFSKLLSIALARIFNSGVTTARSIGDFSKNSGLGNLYLGSATTTDFLTVPLADVFAATFLVFFSFFAFGTDTIDA